MRPAQFKPTYEHTTSSGVKLVSDSSLEQTCVLNSTGEVSYEMSIFTGRKAIFLSPDGSVLVLDGNYHFGPSMMREPSDEGKDEIAASIYLNGSLVKEIHYSEIISDTMVDEWFGVSIGGGWVKRSEFISSGRVDWDKMVLIYQMARNAGTREISLVDLVSEKKSEPEPKPKQPEKISEPSQDRADGNAAACCIIL